jgi:Adenylate and Guanylate cyclase catalytic domain
MFSFFTSNNISSRNPGQVFMLLEVLYGAFDKIASQRRVFKVETIGDCYVAATGLVSETELFNLHTLFWLLIRELPSNS